MKLLIFGTMIFLQTQIAFAMNTLNISAGPSAPKDTTEQRFVLTSGASRSGGGEHFILKLGAPKTVTEIKITTYSASRNGKNLIRAVNGLNGATPIAIPELSQFSKVTAGNPTNYNGLVMIADGSYVQANPNQAFTGLDFTVEGFSNDDTSLVFQISFAEELTEQQFIMTRSIKRAETIGSLIDESNYAKFGANELNKLMNAGTAPVMGDLVGKSFVCSSYTKLDASQINLKTRGYYASADGGLLSSSDLEGSDVIWGTTPIGVATRIQNQNGCGLYFTQNVIRKTASGSLIAEVIVDLEAYVALCAAAGYDADGVRAVEANSTFPSAIAPQYVVDSYEYCRPAN